MTKNYKQRKALIVLLSTIFLSLFMLNTNPRELSAPYLLVPPLLVFLILYLLASIGLETYTLLSKQKRKVVSGVAASGPLVLLLLASLGQLTARDSILSVLFIAGLAAYSSRVTVSGP